MTHHRNYSTPGDEQDAIERRYWASILHILGPERAQEMADEQQRDIDGLDEIGGEA
jgi:hypothetical protein